MSPSNRHCERSEAIQNSKEGLDCFVASAPRNDESKAISRIVWSCVAIVSVAILADGALHDTLAQSPFGGARPVTADPHAHGIVGWLLDRQSNFYRRISATIRAAKTDGSAVWTLLGVSFAYGVFHAAGPGHGKAVISSYLVANEETARRGIVLSFASALLQALVAVVVVGVAAWLLNATMQTMCTAERAIEIVSYALIAALGARLVWTKGRGFFSAVSDWRSRPTIGASPALAGMPVSLSHGHQHHADSHHEHAHGHHHHGHDRGHAAHGEPGHVHDEHCGHNHGPAPSELSGPGGWTRGLGAIVAVGLRPCSGAILVLVFALAQGLFWAGIAAAFVMGLGTALTVAVIAVMAVGAKGFARRLSTGRDGGGAIALRGIELGAAAVVLLFGAGLLIGYVAAERATCL